MTVIQVLMSLSWYQSICLQDMLFSTDGVFIIVETQYGLDIYQNCNQDMYRYHL